MVAVRRAGWRSPLGLVSPDDVGALAEGWNLSAVRNDPDRVVSRVTMKLVGEAMIQGGGVGEVQRNVGEVAMGDELGEDTRVARVGNACRAGWAAGADAGRQDNVAGG